VPAPYSTDVYVKQQQSSPTQTLQQLESYSKLYQKYINALHNAGFVEQDMNGTWMYTDKAKNADEKEWPSEALKTRGDMYRINPNLFPDLNATEATKKLKQAKEEQFATHKEELRRQKNNLDYREKYLRDMQSMLITTVDPIERETMNTNIQNFMNRTAQLQQEYDTNLNMTSDQVYERNVEQRRNAQKAQEKADEKARLKEQASTNLKALGELPGKAIKGAREGIQKGLGWLGDKAKGVADTFLGEGAGDYIGNELGGMFTQALQGAPQESPEQNALREREATQRRAAAQLEEQTARAKGEADRNVQAVGDQWTESQANNAANIAAAAQGGDTGAGSAIARMEAAQHARDTVGAENQKLAQQRADTYEKEVGQRTIEAQDMTDRATATRLKSVDANNEWNNVNSARKEQEEAQDKGDAKETSGPTQAEMTQPGEKATGVAAVQQSGTDPALNRTGDGANASNTAVDVAENGGNAGHASTDALNPKGGSNTTVAQVKQAASNNTAPTTTGTAPTTERDPMAGRDAFDKNMFGKFFNDYVKRDPKYKDLAFRVEKAMLDGNTRRVIQEYETKNGAQHPFRIALDKGDYNNIRQWLSSFVAG
jgi:hypothetical protein